MLTRLGCLFGLLLTLFAFVMLALFVIIPAVSSLNDNATFTGIMGSLLCRDGETYRADAYQTSYGSTTNYTFTAYCDQPSGLTRKVTDKQTLYGVVAFVAPFLLGLGLSIAGIIGASVRAARRVVQNPGAIVLGSDFAAAAARHSSRASNAPTLAERLQQLQDARDRGLINETEYERARRKLLDEGA